MTPPTGTGADWFRVRNVAEIPSPALLLFEERIDANLRAMVAMAGDPGRLRPHVKTHKLRELLVRQLAMGISRFKCATIAEAEMVAEAGGADVLLAYQLVGPQLARLAALARRYPGVRFSSLVDAMGPAVALSGAAREAAVRLGVFVDLNIGQDRTGIVPGPAAAALYREAAGLPHLEVRGLHAYDGHLALTDPVERERRSDEAYAPVAALRLDLEAQGLGVPVVVAGGSPTFPCHARRAGVELSPGTTVLWDAGYAARLPDLPFLPAAVLLARVISRPAPGRLCLDLGHKAVGSEMPRPRVQFLNLAGAEEVGHSEEHLVVAVPDDADFPVGTEMYALPWHVCPTVALHEWVWPVRGGRAGDPWEVTARRRRLTL